MSPDTQVALALLAANVWFVYRVWRRERRRELAEREFRRYRQGGHPWN